MNNLNKGKLMTDTKQKIGLGFGETYPAQNFFFFVMLNQRLLMLHTQR